MRRAAIVSASLMLLLCFLPGCRKRLGTLALDVYVHPESGTPDDVLLETAIRKELAQNKLTAEGVYVRVLDLRVVLTGAVSNSGAQSQAFEIARAVKIVVNNETIGPANVTNLIKVEK